MVTTSKTTILPSMKNICITILSLLSFITLAGTYTTTSTSGTWAEGGSPGSADDIVVNHDWSAHNSGLGYFYSILDGGSITVNASGHFKIWGNLTTRNSAAISVSSSAVLEISGNFVIEATSASVVFDGGVIISGNTNNASTITGVGTWTYAGTWVNGGTVNGVSGDLGGSPIDLGTLPVTLIEFTVTTKQNGQILNWITASEINNDYFELQKSEDGINFEVIAIVNGNGNSSEVNRYAFLDENKAQQVYYRIKQFDFDGSYSYSHIISTSSVSKNISINQINASNDFYILTEQQDQYNVKTFSINGQLLAEHAFEGRKGTRHNFTLANQHLCVIVVSNSREQVSLKTIIH